MTDVAAHSPAAQTFASRLSHRRLLAGYMVAKMPLGALAGLQVLRLDGHICEVAVPYGWRTKNPFGSIYFAALAMAAELSCAGLALMASRAPAAEVAVYPVGLSGEFIKQAKQKTIFTCTDGPALFDAVKRAVDTGEPIRVQSKTSGRTQDGIEVSRFEFTWSYKRKR